MTSRRVRWDLGLPVSRQVGLRCYRHTLLASCGSVRGFNLIELGTPVFGVRAGGGGCLACPDWTSAPRRVLATATTGEGGELAIEIEDAARAAPGHRATAAFNGD